MSFTSGYHYLLNHNYGKVVVGLDYPSEYVAVYSKDQKMQHFKCVGEIDYLQARTANDMDLGYISTFFGSPCFREAFEHSWTYINDSQYLLAFVTVSEVSIVTLESLPLVVTKGDARYANFVLPEKIDTVENTKIDNVVYLKR